MKNNQRCMAGNKPRAMKWEISAFCPCHCPFLNVSDSFSDEIPVYLLFVLWPNYRRLPSGKTPVLPGRPSLSDFSAGRKRSGPSVSLNFARYYFRRVFSRPYKAFVRSFVPSFERRFSPSYYRPYNEHLVVYKGKHARNSNPGQYDG